MTASTGLRGGTEPDTTTARDDQIVLALHLRRFVAGLAALVATVSAPHALANQVAAPLVAGAKGVGAAGSAYRAVVEDEGNLVVVPVPIIDPTIGNGLALAGLYTFGTSQDPTAPRSTLGVAAGYTDSETWAVGAGFNVHLKDDRYRVGLVAGFGEVNLQYFGVGSDSIFADNPVDFLGNGTFGSAYAEVRLMKSFYAGLTAKFLDADIGTRLPIDVLPELSVPFDLFGVGPTLEYDTRDNSWSPTRGVHATAELLWYKDTSEVFSFDLEGHFTTFDASVSSYRLIADDLVLAGQAGIAKAGEDTPFFMNPFVSIRGFPSGKYLDSAVAQAQGELRWDAWSELGLGVVAFAGVGVTGPEIGDIDNTAYGYGAGLRYMVSKADRMNVGFDIATDNEEHAFYFRIGEAF